MLWPDQLQSHKAKVEKQILKDQNAVLRAELKDNREKFRMVLQTHLTINPQGPTTLYSNTHFSYSMLVVWAARGLNHFESSCLKQHRKYRHRKPDDSFSQDYATVESTAMEKSAKFGAQNELLRKWAADALETQTEKDKCKLVRFS